MNFLTKSDFTAAQSCPTKLFYKKQRYPSLSDENSYLEFLADGGYMIEAMARLLFPDGRELASWEDPEEAFKETSRLVEAGSGTFFEATIICNGLLARIDILTRDKNVLRLVEVKSSSLNSIEDGENPFRGSRGDILAKWRPYLEDLTFQTLLLREVFPQFTVAPFLCVADKAKVATENATFEKFRLRRDDGQWRPSVEYLGNVDELGSANVLAIVDASSEVDELTASVKASASHFAETLKPNPIVRIVPKVGQHCKSCEYRTPFAQGEKSGFKECWGELAAIDPHILDLFRVDLLGGKKRDVVAELAAENRAGVGDIPMQLITGASASRQQIQIEHSANNTECIAPQLPEILGGHPYPLHFIDFEGSRLAVPFHAGMRSYEQASFQWSCHSYRSAGGQLEHAEWLNTEDTFPNFEFANALRHRIGNDGTVYIWSHYEIDALNEIKGQMKKYHHEDPDLLQWIEGLTAKGSRIVDMCTLAKDYYFHPAMKGSLSIKHVLPAVWNSSDHLPDNPSFCMYAARDSSGKLRNPYDTLTPLPIGGAEECVMEGTGAMRVYQEMMFGVSRDNAVIRQSYRDLLLQYCKLDTAAMVMIWMHWMQKERNQAAATTTK